MANRTFGWKTLVARTLLVPIIAGSGVAAGQTAPKPGSPTTPTSAVKSKATSPADLIKEGKAALARGQFDAAMECCVKAEQAAAAQKYSWGIIETTPTSLRKNITEAKADANKAQAALMMKECRGLMAKKSAGDAERMANLDAALQKAHQAASLHGPYGFLDSDKPDSLIAGIKAEQESLRKKGVALPAPTMTAANSPAKADVMKVVAEGRMLLAQDKVLEAKAKGDAARRMAEQKGVLTAFNAGEDSPDELVKACKVKGESMIGALMADCDKQIAIGENARAAAAAQSAMELTTALGFNPRPISEKLAKIKPVATAPQMAGLPTPSMPVMPVKNETLTPVAPPSILVQQAANELRLGNLEMARTCAIKAINTEPASKSEATAILREIDVRQAGNKRHEAGQTYMAALEFYGKKDYARAKALLEKIDANNLADDQRQTYMATLHHCTSITNPIKLAGADDLKPAMADLNAAVKKADLPPIVTSPVTPPAGVNPIMDTQKAAADVLFDKLRSEAITVMQSAGEAWGRGETDSCMRTLEEFAGKVKASTLSEVQKRKLLPPIEARMQGYAVMKHNYDFELKEAKQKIENRNQIIGSRVAEANKQDEIKKKFAEVSDLQKQGKYKEAEALALQVKTLDPDNPMVTALHESAKFRRRVEDNKKWKAEDEQFVFDTLNQAERMGPSLTNENPLVIDPNRHMIAARRGQDTGTRARTEREMRLEGRLSANYPLLKFENMPLKDVINRIKKDAQINITIDETTLDDEKLTLDSVIINEEFTDLSLQSALKIILEKGRLVHIVEDDVVKITTQKKTRGKMKTKVFHVMDLVTPIPEYKLSPHHTLGGAIEASKALPPAIAGMGGVTPYAPKSTMGGGELISGQSGAAATTGSGGQLINGSTVAGPNAMTPQRTQYAQQLVNMVTQMVNQQSWAANGTAGGGTIAYYDIGGAMVVNQTADVISEVQALLDNLRRLQDLSVSVELRVVSLSETYFERIGVDFQANVTTNNTTFQQQIATGQFTPQPFLNSINANGVTTGWSPATGFTSDLGVPVRATSYNLTAPPFGGYQNSLSPTLNGGLSLGLAFLNDIQVYMFLEAAAGNRRINIMQAPKITLFNGQTSTVFVGDLAYFATGLQVYSAGGQFVYLPVNQAFPIGQGFNPNGTGTGTSSGVSVTVQAVISADRRFVRLNLTPSLTALASATVPLYPITTFITPVFEGGSQGQPIPFTQFFQQPSFTEISAQTTVAIPDGGTVLMGGLKTLAQGRNEFGPPVLSNVPYLNRLFKNVGIGQETRHVMLMVTPRIIINSEEEARQTGENTGAGSLQP